jgi:hypothetical protein
MRCALIQAAMWKARTGVAPLERAEVLGPELA